MDNLLLLTTQDIVFTLWEGADTPVNDATASAVVTDMDGTSVLGEGVSIDLEYSGLGDGVYKGSIPGDADIATGTKYKVIATAVGTGWQTTVTLELLASAYKGG